MNKNLIIGGVHKAGTTSLYTYLSQHPSVCCSNIKETHFFSYKILDGYKPKYDSYSSYFNHCSHEASVLVESSPEYLVGGRDLALNIKKNLENPTVVIILRNPIEKLYSSFNHKKKMVVFPESYSFDEFICQHVEGFESKSVKRPYDQELSEGFYTDNLSGFIDVFNDDLEIMFYEELTNNALDLVQRICNKVEIDPAFYEDFDFLIENKTVQYRSQFFQKITYWLSMQLEPLIRKKYGLKVLLRSIYNAVNTVERKKGISKESQEILERLYGSENKKLLNLLKDKGVSNMPEWLLKYES